MWHILKLTLTGPLHVGHDIAGVGIENVQPWAHSDTLYSALISAVAEEKPSLLDKLLNADFRMTSCFPWSGENYYLPRPLAPVPAWFTSRATRVRATDWLDLHGFFAWQTGRFLPNADVHLATGIQAGSASVTRVRPRNALDRLTSASMLYHCGEVYFKSGSGLYFVLDADNGVVDRVAEGLEILGRLGLGGRRSTGGGRFRFEQLSAEDSEWRRIRNAEGDASTLLSLWYPTAQEKRGLTDDSVAYRLVPRRGWAYWSMLGSQMKRNPVQMLGEGSVFRTEPKGGEPVDLAPAGAPQKALRWGRAFSVRLNLAGWEEQ